jgi:hypothetical protein
VNEEMSEALFSTVTGFAAILALTILHSTILIANIIGESLIKLNDVYWMIGIVIIVSYFLVYRNKSKILYCSEILLNNEKLKQKWDISVLVYSIFLFGVSILTMFSNEYGRNAMIM